MKIKRTNVKLDVDSALSIMQEIYNDITLQKNTANVIMKKMLVFMKDSEDMSMIGPVIKEQQKILNDCTEKKLSLVKLQALLLKQTNAVNKTPQSTGKLELSDEDKKILESLLNNDENEEKYSL